MWAWPGGQTSQEKEANETPSPQVELQYVSHEL